MKLRFLPLRSATPDFLTVTLLCISSATHAQMLEFAQKKNCMACHQVERKVLGPAFKDVAKKYSGQADVAARLVDKVQKGGSGVWGPVPMPPNPQVDAVEAALLVGWILTLK